MFRDNIQTADLAKLVPCTSFKRGVKHFVCVIDVFTKSAWIKLFTNKKSKISLDDFIGIVN